jgi:hypothetical protein
MIPFERYLVKIQPSGAFAAYSHLNISSHPKQAPADIMVNVSGSGANISDTVSISRTARNRLADPSNSAAAPRNGATAVFDTDQGSRKLNIEAYFSPGGSENNAAFSFQTLPPLLFPSRNNIDALTNHISATLPQFLAQNNIPSAPSSITYDNKGQIQLPSDYAYASEFKQSLANNPTMAKELSTVNALTSHFVEIQKAVPFQQEYAAAATQAEVDAVVARYGCLFSDNHRYETIALQFSPEGRLSLTRDGKPLIWPADNS